VTVVLDKAYVSGALRQAIYIEDGHSTLLSLSDENTPRRVRPNDLSFFFAETTEFRPIENTPNGSLTLSTLREILACESKIYDALDAIIGGMDRRLSTETRRRKITDGDKLLADTRASVFVENRLFSAAPTKLLDVEGAIQIARGTGAKHAEQVYRIIAAGGPSKAESAFIAAVDDLAISGVEAAVIKWQLIEAGAFRIAAASLVSGHTNRLQEAALGIARQSRTSPTTRRVLFALAKSIASPLAFGSTKDEAPEPEDDEFETTEEAVSLEDLVYEALNDRSKRRLVRRWLRTTWLNASSAKSNGSRCVSSKMTLFGQRLELRTSSAIN
jgi:hypothetical protein